MRTSRTRNSLAGKFLTLAAFSILADHSPLRADEIHLRNGRRLVGLIEDGAETVLVTWDPATGTERKRTIPRADIEWLYRTRSIGDQPVDLRLASMPRFTAGDFRAVVLWARDRGHGSWRLVARLGLRDHPEDAELNRLLGHEEVGGRWLVPEAAAEARRRLIDASAESKGLVPWRGAWIQKDSVDAAERDPASFLMDAEHVWRPAVGIRRDRGQVLFRGEWIQGSPEVDRFEQRQFRELVGPDISVLSTPHFRLAAQELTWEQLEDLAVLAESAYQWFQDLVRKPQEDSVFGGERGSIWILKDESTARAWKKHYQPRYHLPDSSLGMKAGSIMATRLLLAMTVIDEVGDLRQTVVHQAVHFVVESTLKGFHETPPWLAEAFAHHAESALLVSGGEVTCFSRGTYHREDGVAEKRFSTRDARAQVKALIREGADEPVVNLMKLGFNELNRDHLAKGWSLLDWLLTEHREECFSWFEGMNHMVPESALRKSFPEWDFGKLDAEWADHVRSRY